MCVGCTSLEIGVWVHIINTQEIGVCVLGAYHNERKGEVSCAFYITDHNHKVYRVCSIEEFKGRNCLLTLEVLTEQYIDVSHPSSDFFSSFFLSTLGGLLTIIWSSVSFISSDGIVGVAMEPMLVQGEGGWLSWILGGGCWGDKVVHKARHDITQWYFVKDRMFTKFESL